MKRWLAGLLALACASVQAQSFDERVLDDFRDAAAWTAAASDEVQAKAVRAPDGALCLAYDFGRVSGYAVLRRALPITFPSHYALTLKLHGSGPPNALQVKFTDATGDNVWWLNKPGYRPPAAMSELVIRQRQVEFAWGPTADRLLTRSAGVELVVASGAGGRGELCFDRLALRTLDVREPPPTPVAGASVGGDTAARALDGDTATAWQADTRGSPSWQVDFGQPRELSGLLLRWAGGARASDFDVQLSDDGRRWRTVRSVRGSQRDALPVWLAGSDPAETVDTRYLRLVLQRGPQPRYALAEVVAAGPAEWPTLDGALKALAAAEPRGRLPRAYLNQQNYWTLVGVDGGGAHAALVSEDGAIEPRKAGPSVEPFVVDEPGAVLTWADAQPAQSLRDGFLPLPQVRWSGAGYTLAVEAGADGPPAAPSLVARYTLTNTGTAPRRLTLALAVRPWQVNPPQQFLNTPGGVSPIASLAWRDGMLSVGGVPWLRALDAPASVGAAPFAQGDPLALSGLPPLQTLDDPDRLASALLRWPVALAPGESRSIAVDLPLNDAAAPAETRSAAERLDAIAAAWRTRLGRVTLELPPAAQPLADTLKSSLAHMLMSRDGPALQPGTRSYARAWVRDGAMMTAGLLRLGERDAAREFVEWYARHLFANGKVPCCVDARGADPVAENDSHGEFIYAVAELWRHARDDADRAAVAALWPQVDAAARYMESLAQQERTAANRAPGREAFFGMMPASISHEGYSAQPMHAYWDNFWALAGYRDAAMLAAALAPAPRAAELAAQRDRFRADLKASLAAAVAQHRIDFLPGAAELGDFDPSSSTLIFSPAGAEALVPRALLDGTWGRWWRESVARRDGTRDWKDYTPYELRSVSALVRMGRVDQAHAMLDFFMRDRRPAAWNQWAEVVGRDAREPRFVGDMPHAWISSDYIRSALDLLAYERPSDDALVLAAGVPEAWWRQGPVGVQGLDTPYGALSWRLAPDGPSTMVLRVQPGLRMPPGGLWLAWQGRLLRVPGDGTLRLPVAAVK